MCDTTTKDEYDYDTSDEEDVLTTIGNVPAEWYEHLDHVGYTVDSKKILKPAKGDNIDNLLEKTENPDHWKTLKDEFTGQNIILEDNDLNLVKRIAHGQDIPLNFNPYTDLHFPSDICIHPLGNSLLSKKSLKNRIEREIKLMERKRHIVHKPPQNESPYDLWNSDIKLPEKIIKLRKFHIPPPKMSLPGHEESYNPPEEYLLSDQEAQNLTPDQIRPHKHNSIRSINSYDNYIKERFDRLLDLYLCPRKLRLKANYNVEDLLPEIPDTSQYMPFPSKLSLQFKGHEESVRCIAIDSAGLYLVSGSDDRSVKFWSLQTTRCLQTIKFESECVDVAFIENSNFMSVAVVLLESVEFVVPSFVSPATIKNTAEFFSSIDISDEMEHFRWSRSNKSSLLSLQSFSIISKAAWHRNFTYFATVQPQQDSRSLAVHQFSKARSKFLFRRPKGQIQDLKFHQRDPSIFIATKRHILVYNLMTQSLLRKYDPYSQWISCLAIHPLGNDFLVGSYDCRLHWFDAQLKTKPYKTLSHHEKPVLSVDFHRSYPLFASTSSDNSVFVFHGKVEDDLTSSATIVPLKILKGHADKVYKCLFHPLQPWILSCGADGIINLYT